MHIAVLIEPLPGKGYRARGGEPFALEAEGSTKEEALQKLRALITLRIVGGAEVVCLDVPAQDNPWIAFAGMFKSDPLFDAWQAAIAERREVPE
jgi:hypothetical protein